MYIDRFLNGITPKNYYETLVPLDFYDKRTIPPNFR